MSARAAVVLLGRPDCHLCDVARTELSELAARHPSLSVSERNIDEDPDLLRSFLERIPVVLVDGREVCELGLDADAVLEAAGILSS